MRSALIIGVSVLALGLGGCSSMESTTDTGGGDQSAPAAQPARSSDMSGTSQAPTPQPHEARPMPQSKTAAATSGSGSTMHHHPMHASNEVRTAQQKLKDDGDYMGQIDGLAGPQTRQAVTQYQKKNGLKQTGHLDHATLSKLGVGGGAASSGSSMPPASGGTSGSGSSRAPASGGGNDQAAPAGNNSGGTGHQL